MVAVVAVVLLVARALPSERVECLSVTSSPSYYLPPPRGAADCAPRKVRCSHQVSVVCRCKDTSMKASVKFFLYTYMPHI